MNTNTVTNDVAVGHVLYFDSSTAMLRFNDQCTRLDHKTFQLLCYFVAHHDQIVERRVLMSHLWKDQHASDASLGRLISVLRKILAINGHKFIFTIHKTGYRFAIPADVRFIAANPTIKKVPVSAIHSTIHSTIHSNVHSIDAKRSPESTELSDNSLTSQSTFAASVNSSSAASNNSADVKAADVDGTGSNPDMAIKRMVANGAIRNGSIDNGSINNASNSNSLNNNALIQATNKNDADIKSQSAVKSSKIKYLFSAYFMVVLIILVGIYWDLNSRQIDNDHIIGMSVNLAAVNDNRIVILPFEQFAEPIQPAEFSTDLAFMAGLSTELVNSLTNISDLQVVDKHKSAQYRNNKTELNRIAVNHGARYVLKGNVRKQQNTIRIGVQVVDSIGENILISAVYEQDIGDGFAAQIKIATQVADEFQQTLSKRSNSAKTHNSDIN